MATTVTIKDVGGDYTSLAAAESDNQQDLTGTGTFTFNCFDFQDTTALAIAGWTTTASDYIIISTELAERHDGRSRDVTGTGYQLTDTNTSGTLRIAEEFVRIEGIDVKNTGTSPQAISTPTTLSATSDIRIDKCICHDALASASSNYVLDLDENNAIFTVTNTIVYGKGRGSDFRGGNVTVRYCTYFTDAASHGILSDSGSDIKNTFAGGYSTEDFFGTTTTGSHCASEDASADDQFTSSLINLTTANQFVNASLGSSADFTLKSGSDLEAAGTPIGGITTDIIGTTRDGTTPDIGAFEFISAVPAASLLLMQRSFRQ